MTPHSPEAKSQIASCQSWQAALPRPGDEPSPSSPQPTAITRIREHVYRMMSSSRPPTQNVYITISLPRQIRFAGIRRGRAPPAREVGVQALAKVRRERAVDLGQKVAVAEEQPRLGRRRELVRAEVRHAAARQARP